MSGLIEEMCFCIKEKIVYIVVNGMLAFAHLFCYIFRYLLKLKVMLKLMSK